VLRERGVFVTSHAREQAARRFPELRLDSARIEAEVREAIASGRTRRRKPSWAGRRTTTKGVRFAWSADRARLYVLHASPDRLTVKTVIEVGA
jgi:hypothetical protein